jgi:hypothetical protein
MWVWKLWGCGLWGVESCVEVKLQNKYFFRIIEYMKKVGSSFKILSVLIVGGMILCLLFKMLSREGFSACRYGAMCNTAEGDRTCTVNEGKTCKVGDTTFDLSYTLKCKEAKDSTEGKWIGNLPPGCLACLGVMC